MAYVKFNKNKTKSEAVALASEHPDTIYFTKESETDTSGNIIINGVEYGVAGVEYVVATALNELQNITSNIGNLSNLLTTEKTNTVAAINELKQNANPIDNTISYNYFFSV